MPLDGHAFLVNQGWSGTGTGLRNGAIPRPITASQKRNQAGIGRDRDDAFPFWDHLFAVAASAIQIECFSSDDDQDGPQSDTKRPALELRQTSTGILSNRPPVVVSSGETTPAPCFDVTPSSSAPRLSLLSLAKRETARRCLYSRFFRGATLGPDDIQFKMVKTEPTATHRIPSPSHDSDHEKKNTKKRRKIDSYGEDPDKEARRREKRLRNEAEKTARKLRRRKEKDKAKVGISTAPSKTLRARSEKKKKERMPTVDDEFDAHPPARMDEGSLEGEDHGQSRRKGSLNFARKRLRRDQSL